MKVARINNINPQTVKITEITQLHTIRPYKDKSMQQTSSMTEMRGFWETFLLNEDIISRRKVAKQEVVQNDAAG